MQPCLQLPALGAVVKTAERRETELQAELEGANKSLKELENTIRVLQIRHETEVSKLKDEHLGNLSFSLIIFIFVHSMPTHHWNRFGFHSP